MEARCVCVCVSCSVSFRVCMCVGLRVLWLSSVTCVGHVLSLPGWGRSRETAEHKGETQTSRQAASRQQAGRRPARAPGPPPPQGCSGWGRWSLGLGCTYCHNVPVFNHVLTNTHASLMPSLTPILPFLTPRTLMPLPKWFSLKTNIQPWFMASIIRLPYIQEKDSPLLAILGPLSPNRSLDT